MKREIPMPGQIYRHFKNNLYQVLSLAEHTETKELLVIYQSLYGSFKVYARPLTMFLSEVDSEKYPDAQQQYRFEMVKNIGACAVGSEDSGSTVHTPAPSSEPATKESFESEFSNSREVAEDAEQNIDEDMEVAINPLLLKFLDTDSYAEKLEVLEEIRNQLDNRLIDDIATVIDVVIEEGAIKNRYESLKACIETMVKYECGRLR